MVLVVTVAVMGLVILVVVIILKNHKSQPAVSGASQPTIDLGPLVNFFKNKPSTPSAPATPAQVDATLSTLDDLNTILDIPIFGKM